MRRKTTSYIIALLLAVVTGLILLWLEVSEMITQDNSYWLLIGIFIGVFLIIVVLIWGYWPTIKGKRLVRPNYYSGFVNVGKVRAGASLKVVAKVGDYTSDTVATNSAGYYNLLEVKPPNASYKGLPVEFYVEGKKVAKTEDYMGGGHRPTFFNLEINDQVPHMPKLPSPELRVYYLKHEFGVSGEGKYTGLSVDNGTRILSIEAEFSPTGPMRIEAVKLRVVARDIPSLNWKVQEYTDLCWGSPSNAFDVSEISPGKHDTELWALVKETWWGPYLFSIVFPEVNS